RLRLLGLRELREPGGREDRQGPDAETEGEAPWWSRRARRRLRRCVEAVLGTELVGHGLGRQGLLHDSLRLPDGLESVRRLLDDQAGLIPSGQVAEHDDQRRDRYSLALAPRGRRRLARKA